MTITNENARRIAVKDITKQRQDERFAELDLSNTAVTEYETTDALIYAQILSDGKGKSAWILSGITKNDGSSLLDTKLLEMLTKGGQFLSTVDFNLRDYLEKS